MITSKSKGKLEPRDNDRIAEFNSVLYLLHYELNSVNVGCSFQAVVIDIIYIQLNNGVISIACTVILLYY